MFLEWFGEETPRYVYVSREVGSLIWEPDHFDEQFGVETKALIDSFVEGGHISVGWNPHAKDTCLMARVDSGDRDYEMWDMRVLAPKPGVRILGGFAEQDVFLGLTWDYRDNFDGQWLSQIGRCVREWTGLFGDCRPFQGKSVDEYLSEPFSTV